MTCWNSWHRWSLISIIAAALLAVSLTPHNTTPSGDDDHAPAKELMVALTRPELLRLLRAFVLPKPATDPEHVLRCPAGDADISTGPPPATAAGTKSPQPHDHELQLPCQSTRLLWLVLAAAASLPFDAVLGRRRR